MNEALEAPGVGLRSDTLIALRRVALAAESAPALAALPGGFATRRKGHGLEVADMREYVAGDDLRHLDRGTTARTGRLHVRQFQEERDRVSLLVADFRPAMFWGLRRAFRSVCAAEALSLIGWSVVESGGRVGLLALTGAAPVIVPARGRSRGMLDVIGGMVEAHQAGLAALAAGQGADPPLDQALSRADRLVPPGAELVIASGFDKPGLGLADRLSALARRRRPRLLLVTDAQIGRMPRGRYPIRTEDGRRIRLSLGGAAAAAEEPARRIAGRPALVLDAGETVEQTARRIVAGLTEAQAA
ncbi:DUF58 domain-containing protein [Roseobacter sinensis]|uniref:DUF58 domain-containing protein n=1 Tax=Roseobacter sinensis TaxID=2931391 RepID=A0ABT3BKE6_9RHOB|nr:DUF58 domain-containing protein [Roseobacter sp. WL0113]MCV3274053.1 DUF58 domain-containing protein [Roseobacter sp. WL0113]